MNLRITGLMYNGKKNMVIAYTNKQPKHKM